MTPLFNIAPGVAPRGLQEGLGPRNCSEEHPWAPSRSTARKAEVSKPWFNEPYALGRSVGCILAELLGRDALFKGSDYIDQLRKIVAAVGRPEGKELDFIASSRARAFVSNLEGPVSPKP